MMILEKIVCKSRELSRAELITFYPIAEIVRNIMITLRYEVINFSVPQVAWVLKQGESQE